MLRIWWRKLRTRLILVVIAAGFVAAFPGDTPGGNSVSDKVLGKAGDILFNYVAWEVQAIGYKLNQVQGGAAPYLDEGTRSSYVDNYLKQVNTLQQLEGRINAIYSNPTISDPDEASRDFRTQRDQQRQLVDRLQPTAESIIETQVAAVLRDEGFSVLGEILPPVSAHLTSPPMLLVVSPRDTIRYDFATNILNLNAAEANALENEIDHTANVSSLVVPIGGIGLYPTMVMETWTPVYLFETVAHEWSHNYMLFFPIGVGYFTNPETRILNETAATLFGKEIGRKVIERYYRDFPNIMAQLPPAPVSQPTPRPDTAQATPAPTATPFPHDPDERPSFDFAAELNRTRVTVDFYLHFGLVDLAERYMEGQRRVFAANRYAIRKLNQAFFAFYGGYQGAGGSNAGGADPIGPAMQQIRDASPSLKAWLEIVRGITTRQELLTTRDKMLTSR